MAQTCQQCGNEIVPGQRDCSVCHTPVRGTTQRNQPPPSGIELDGQCSWSNGHTAESNGSEPTRCQVRTKFFLCVWHRFNAVGHYSGFEGPPRSSGDRELFDEWLPTLDDDHPWLKVDPDKLWNLTQGKA